MAIYKVIKDNQLYLYMNGNLIYKRWLITGQSIIFDVMTYDKNTLISINDKKQLKMISVKKVRFYIENINKLRSLNDKLKKEEERIRPFAKQLFDVLNKQKTEKQIDDFNVWQELIVIINKGIHCSKCKNVAEKNPNMEKKDFLLFGEYTDERFYKDNWNELPKDHPLGNEFFCYTMHSLVFHSYVSWQDIIEIEEVWIELKVDYQFFVKV